MQLEETPSERFDPPHGKLVRDVVIDCEAAEFVISATNEKIRMRGTIRRYGVSSVVPYGCTGIFDGNFETVDFSFPVELHFADTEGVLVERPRLVSEDLHCIDFCESYLVLGFNDKPDEIALVRDPFGNWDPMSSNVLGRIGPTLFTLFEQSDPY